MQSSMETQNHRGECLVVVKTTYLSSVGCKNEDLQELQKPQVMPEYMARAAVNESVCEDSQTDLV